MWGGGGEGWVGVRGGGGDNASQTFAPCFPPVSI